MSGNPISIDSNQQTSAGANFRGHGSQGSGSGIAPGQAFNKTGADPSSSQGYQQTHPGYGGLPQQFHAPNPSGFQGYNTNNAANLHNYSGYRPGYNSNDPAHGGSAGAFNGKFSNRFFTELQNYSEQIDQFLGKVGAPIKPWLPAIGRFFIVATFFEDGYRIFSQWKQQVNFIWKFRGLPKSFAVGFLLLNVVLMYSGSITIVLHRQLVYGAGALVFVVLAQAIVYGLIFNSLFFSRNLSIIGGLLMVLSDAFVRDRRALNLPGLPLAEVRDRARYFQLAGRIMLIFLFISYLLTGLSKSPSVMSIVGGLCGFGACVLVAVGYKARLSALFLVVVLFWRNLTNNMYWHYESGNPLRDFFRYEHFQVLSIIGGLLLVINSGPGAISVDEKKKVY